jgi:hypothetical protein
MMRLRKVEVTEFGEAGRVEVVVVNEDDTEFTYHYEGAVGFRLATRADGWAQAEVSVGPPLTRKGEESRHNTPTSKFT